MKKVIILLLSVMLSFGFAFGQVKSETKYNTKIDSLAIKLDVEFQDKINYSELKAYNEMLKYIASQQNVDKAKVDALELLVEIAPSIGTVLQDKHKTYYSNLHFLEEVYGITPEYYWKCAKQYNRSQEVMSVISYVFICLAIGFIGLLVINKRDWRTILIATVALSIFCVGAIYLLPEFAGLGSELNSDYNIIKTLL